MRQHIGFAGPSLAGAVAAIALTAGVSDEAAAGGFALREQSAYSQGASFAGAATCGESVAGMFWNPAAVTCAKGFEIESSLSLVVPRSDITTNPFPGSLFGPGSPFFNAGDPGDIGEAAVVPAMSAAYNFDDHWFAGITVNGAFGLSTKAAFYNAAQIYGRDSEVKSINVNPIVGYRFNDILAVAAGLQVQYFDVRLTQAISPLIPAPSAELSGDDTALGATVGVMITPAPGTEIGIGYRSGIKHSIDGDLAIPLIGTLPISVEPKLPDMVSAGIRQRITDAFTLLGTVEWTNWSRFGTFPVINDLTGLPVTALPFEYDDGWFFSVGGEYRWDEAWTFRAGLGWEVSPISEEVRSVRLPDDDRLWLSAGLSYDYSDRLKFNLGYSFLTTFDTKIAIGPGNPHYVAPVTYSADVDANVHIVSAGLKYRWGGAEPAAEPAVYKP